LGRKVTTSDGKVERSYGLVYFANFSYLIADAESNWRIRYLAYEGLISIWNYCNDLEEDDRK